MDKELLEKYIQSVVPVTDFKAKQLIAFFDFIEISKNNFTLREGETSKYAYFLESGYMRSYIKNMEGDEVTANLFSAPCFINDFLSFFRQVPTKENFQALTNCRMWRINYENAQSNYENLPEFRDFGRNLLVKSYLLLNSRMCGMLVDSAEIRYGKLLKNHPEIVQNVSLKIIASYLGITATSLSRIRNATAKK